MEAAEVLAGGNVNDVVRIGDTVHRTAGPWTPTIHALLAWVRAHGVSRIPAPLGLDAAGREILTYLPGTIGVGPDGGWVWSPAVLADAGRLLRSCHDASVSFPRAGAVWRLAPQEPDEVICLNDVAPYNMVGGPEGLTGFIDVDMAAPGPRVRDLAYLAYRLCPFAEDAEAPEGTDPWARLTALVDAYASPAAGGGTVPAGPLPGPDDVLATIPARVRELADWSQTHAEATGRADLLEHAAMYRRDAARIAELAGGRG